MKIRLEDDSNDGDYEEGRWIVQCFPSSRPVSAKMDPYDQGRNTRQEAHAVRGF
jgi:hypothetical protein